MILLQILWDDILPLFAFIGAGVFLDSKFKIDISTYSRLTIWVVLPCFIFYTMYRYHFESDDLLMIPAVLILLAVMYFLSMGMAHMFHLGGAEKGAFEAVSSFSNAGHIGAALAVMIFTHPPFATGAGSAPHLAEAMGTMVIIMIVMNIVVNTFGAALIRSRGSTVKEVLSFMVKMPALYAAILAILVRSAGIHLEHTFLWPVLTHFNGAFIVLVTVTIGLQLHRSKLRKPDRFILATSFNKLILCPAIAWGVLTLFGGAFSPIASQVFFICAAVPSSMALIIYGVEYGEDAGLVTQSVLFSTVAGALTLTCMIYLARVLFPLAG